VVNLVKLYQFRSVSIGRNWVDQWSLISHQLLLGHGQQASKVVERRLFGC